MQELTNIMWALAKLLGRGTKGREVQALIDAIPSAALQHLNDEASLRKVHRAPLGATLPHATAAAGDSYRCRGMRSMLMLWVGPAGQAADAVESALCLCGDELPPRKCVPDGNQPRHPAAGDRPPPLLPLRPHFLATREAKRISHHAFLTTPLAGQQGLQREV